VNFIAYELYLKKPKIKTNPNPTNVVGRCHSLTLFWSPFFQYRIMTSCWGTHWAIYKLKGKSGKYLGGICQEGLG
jgi:hypothetical protein